MHALDPALLAYAARLLAGTGLDPRTLPPPADASPAAAALRSGWDAAEDGDPR